MKLTWETTLELPKVHVAQAGVWIAVCQPITLNGNRVAAWVHRQGWERSEITIHRSLADAKAWCTRQLPRSP